MKISVITATWNSRATVIDCLDSVASQSYGETEHVVIDGASTDGTLDLLESRRAQFGSLLSEPDRGIYYALNKGLARSTGDVLGFLHSDDVFAGPDVLAAVAQAFDRDPQLGAVYGDLDYVRQQDTTQVVRRWRSSPFSSGALAWGWMPPHPTLYVRRQWYERIGGFDLKYRISADYFSVLSLFRTPAFRATHLPMVMVKMRLGGISNRSIRSLMRKSREDWDALRRSDFSVWQGARALAWKNLGKLHQLI